MTVGEAAAIYRLMDSNHQQNRGDIEGLKTDVGDIKKIVFKLQGSISTLLWLIATGLVLAGVVIGLLTYRKATEESTPHQTHAIDSPREP